MDNIIKKIISCGERQFGGELKARKIIMGFLKKKKTAFRIQKVTLKIPKTILAELHADGRKIPCRACCFKSGIISGIENLTNPLRDSSNKDKKAFSCNPLCDDISLHSFYFEPALAFSYKKLEIISKSKKVSGSVKVEMIKYNAANILVGNLKTPQKIIFTHYDSIGRGTIDNATGTAVVMDTINEKNCRKHLFVLSGCEELSHDRPAYWGYGYRSFEKRHSKIMDSCQEIIIVDSVGNGKSIAIKNNLEIFRLGFPIKNLSKLAKKITILTGDIHNLMKVYHSNSDNFAQVSPFYLGQVRSVLKKMLD